MGRKLLPYLDEDDREYEYEDREDDGIEPLDYGDDEIPDFSDPGGESALRAETSRDFRNKPCPTCHHPNRLTSYDVSLGYQCDQCACACERGGEFDYYEGND